jgi:hypothetical protein
MGRAAMVLCFEDFEKAYEGIFASSTNDPDAVRNSLVTFLISERAIP